MKQQQQQQQQEEEEEEEEQQHTAAGACEQPARLRLQPPPPPTSHKSSCTPADPSHRRNELPSRRSCCTRGARLNSSNAPRCVAARARARACRAARV